MKFTRIASAIVLAYGLSAAAMAQVASTQNTDGGSTSNMTTALTDNSNRSTTLASSTTPQSQTQLSHPATVPRLRIGLAMSEGRWARHRDLATRRWDLFCWSSKSSLDTPWKWPS